MMDGERQAMVPGRDPDWRFALFRSDEAQILPTWDAMGLRGTGSHDVTVHGLRVPPERLVAPIFEQARHEGPWWRIPFFTALGTQLVGVPLGVARRALDELRTLAPNKRRGDGAQPLSADSHVQFDLAAPRVACRRRAPSPSPSIGDIWNTAVGGDPPSLDQRARATLACQQAMRAAIVAVDTAFELAGVGGSHHPPAAALLPRRPHAASHIFYSPDFYSPDRWRIYAQHVLGLAPQPPFV